MTDQGQREGDAHKRIPLVVAPDNRDETTSKDARLINAYMERADSGEYRIVKRPGFANYIQPPGTTAFGAGVYNWKGDIYSIFAGTLYKNGSSVGGVDGTGPVYRFSIIPGGTGYMLFGNGVGGYYYNGTVGIVNCPAAFPTYNFYRGWAYLDQTTYIMSTPNKIYGSNLNDPTVWNALNVLSAQIEPDQGVGLAKQMVYVIAFKEWSTEVFYDAANATGSPLGSVQGAKQNFGCASIDSVQEIEGALLWMTATRTGGRSIAMMENLSLRIISTKAIDRLLQQADLTTVWSWVAKLGGHKFYVLTIVNANITLVYDITEQGWAQWTDTNGNYVPICSATFNNNQQVIVQHSTNGYLYYLENTYTNDNGSVITVDVYTPNWDGGTKKKKMIECLYFHTDATPGSVIQVRSSDDDYQTWSNFRTVDLNSSSPNLPNGGTTKRRAYHIRHQCDTSLRMMAIEPRIAIGTL